MSERLGLRTGTVSTAAAAALSCAALDAPLAASGELSVLCLDDVARLRGAFQRVAPDDPRATFSRGSGGPLVDVTPGTLHVVLALASADALTPCAPDKIVNRYVRPLLRALTAAGATAHYFGRDWISVGKRPAGFCGFAHDASSGRAVFEALVAVRAPLTVEARASFLGKEPGSLEAITGKTFLVEALAGRIAAAYAHAYAGGVEPLALPPAPRGGASLDGRALAPAWAATCEEAMGEVAAGRDANGVLRLGGELMASRDAVDEAARRVAALEGPAEDLVRDVGAVVDDIFRRPGVVIDGVRSLTSLRDVLVRALTPGSQ